MLYKIIETEIRLNTLLPSRKLEFRPPAELIFAAGEWSKTVWDKAKELGAMPLANDEIEKGTALAGKPVFICGTHRSGTTLVRDLLDSHRQLVVLPSEGSFYTSLEAKLLALPEQQQVAFIGMEWLRRLANPINQPPYWLLGRSSEMKSAYVDFARYILAWWQRIPHRKNGQWPHTVIILAYASCTGRLAAKYWVDKTPTNERFLGRIWRENPEAKILHIVREPFSILSSRKKMEPSLNMRRALLDIKLSFQVAIEQQALNDPRFLLLHYEALCEAPQIHVERMASFLGIKHSEALLQPSVAGMIASANSSFNKVAAPGRILLSGQHLQNDVLTVMERQIAIACLGDLSGQLNYPIGRVGLLKNIYLGLRHRLW